MPYKKVLVECPYCLEHVDWKGFKRHKREKHGEQIPIKRRRKHIEIIDEPEVLQDSSEEEGEESLQQCTVSHKSGTTSLLRKISSLEAQGKLRETEFKKLQQELSMITEEKLNLQKKVINLEQLLQIKDEDKDKMTMTSGGETHLESIKKALAEKTSQLQDTTLNNTQLTVKLRSLQSESEKLTTTNKKLEEILNLKQGELQNMQMRLRQISEMQMGKEQDVSNKVALALKEVQEVNERIKNEFGRREGEWRRVEGELKMLNEEYVTKIEELQRQIGLRF